MMYGSNHNFMIYFFVTLSPFKNNVYSSYINECVGDVFMSSFKKTRSSFTKKHFQTLNIDV